MTRIAIAAPTRAALLALEALLAPDPHLTIVGRGTQLESVLAPDVARRIDVALISVDETSRLRSVLASLDEHVSLPPLVVLCETDRLDQGRALFRLGLRALLPRNAGAREIVAALEAANAGLIALAPEALEAVTAAPTRETVRLQAPSGTGVPLSPREREILALVADGLGNKIVASRLGISEHTVKTHISSIFAKLGADTRAEAVAIGARQGMLLL
ncbi:MAG: response regulator transcription factor [Gemmatimonadaceae bacterium]